jgi:hypothetical protein
MVQKKMSARAIEQFKKEFQALVDSSKRGPIICADLRPRPTVSEVILLVMLNVLTASEARAFISIP